MSYRGAWLLAALVVAGCKTTGDVDKAADKTGSEAPQVDELTNLPLALWSPDQRKATASYYFLVAEAVAMKERNPQKALPMYEAAYSLDPNPYLGSKMLGAKAATGNRDEVMLEARKMVLLYPQDAQMRFLFGRLLAETGQNERAIEQLEMCVQLDPTFETAYLELTELYHANRQTSKAIVVAKDLVKHVPSSLVGWSQLSRLYLTQAQYKEALIPARRAWEMQSHNPHLTQIYALVLQLNGKRDQAVALYEQLYRLDPTDESLTARMVDLYRELGNLEVALKLIDGMIKEGGDKRPGLQIQKALLLWELKRFAEASALLNDLVREHPDSDRLRYLSALGLERIEKFDDALAVYRSLPENSSFRSQANMRIVILLKRLGRGDEAIAFGQQLVNDGKIDWEAFGLLASVYADMQRYDEAAKVLGEGYKRFPAQPRLLFLRGVYQEKAGRIKECVETMHEVIKKDPTNSSAFNYLGYLYVERGENLEEAERLIKRAIELKPNDGFYYDSLGWLYFQKGDYKKAREYLEKALKLEPKEGVIMEHLGDLEKASKNLAKARDYYEKALREELEAKDRSRVQKKLQELAAGGA